VSTVEDLFAPSPAVGTHPVVAATVRICDDLLAPHAPAADDPARGVDPAHLRALAAAGLLSVKIPVAEGGCGADDRVDAESVELLSGACGATWFVVTQHRNPQGLSRGRVKGLPDEAFGCGPAAQRHRAALADASRLTGIAIAHLRRPGRPAVRAEPARGGGWRFTGAADWCTGWGLTDLVMIGATTPDDRYVFALLPAAERPGLRAGPPVPLAVMGGTRTVGLRLDDLAIAGDEVLFDVDGPSWRRYDLARTANTTPAALGLLRRVLVELERCGTTLERPEAVDTAHVLGSRAARLRAEAYALLVDVPFGERTAERTMLRGELAELTVRAAQALVAARSGSALLLSSAEQRWAREAMFHLVQGQTAAVRAAQLAAFTS
jgi:alkylation response protein AidB-like acyl-CoA dehydrogenase